MADVVTAHPALARLAFLAVLLGSGNIWIRPTGPLIDLPSFYWAAHTAFTEHRSPYTIAALEAGAAAIGQRVFPSLYPPPSLLLFYPLTLVSYPTAATLVTVANSLLAAGGVVFVLRNILRVDPSSQFAAVALVYALSFSQIGNTIAHGQVNLLVMLLLAAAWWLLRDHRLPLATAGCLALAIALKTYPVLLLGYLIVNRQYRIVLYTVALVAGITVLGYALLPGAAWLDYGQHIVPTGSYGSRPWQMFDPAIPFNQSLNGFMARLFVPNQWSDVLIDAPRLGSALTYVLALLAVGCTLLRVWQRAALPDRMGADAAWSAMLCVIYLVAPLSWDHHLVILLPACLVALRGIADRSEAVWARLTVAMALCILAWVVPFRDEALQHGWMSLLISVKFYAVVVVWLYLLNLRSRPGMAGVAAAESEPWPPASRASLRPLG